MSVGHGTIRVDRQEEMMMSKMKRSIEQLSNNAVIQEGDRAVRNEHVLLISILECLNEIERRSLYLKEGYSSLYAFCTFRWRYSPSKAGRFIAAARSIVKFPAARRLLAERKITVCGLAKIARLLVEGNPVEILRSVSGKTFAEIEKIVASHQTAPTVRESVRPIGLKEPADNAPNREEDGDLLQTKESQNDTHVGRGPQQDLQEEPEHRYEIRFSASEEFCRDLERAKAVCSRGWNLEAIMGRAIKDLLEKRDPDRKEAQRKKREARKQGQSRDQSEGKLRSQSPNRPATLRGARATTEMRPSGKGVQASPGRSRHIPAQLRDAVFTRDNGRCTYTGSLGIQCDSTAHLQIDHITPFCLGGEHSLENLRLLCGKHNRLAAREMSLTNR